jgi:hypothetical protein
MHTERPSLIRFSAKVEVGRSWRLLANEVELVSACGSNLFVGSCLARHRGPALFCYEIGASVRTCCLQFREFRGPLAVGFKLGHADRRQPGNDGTLSGFFGHLPSGPTRRPATLSKAEKQGENDRADGDPEDH